MKGLLVAFALSLPAVSYSVPNIILYVADDLGVGEVNQHEPEWSFDEKNILKRIPSNRRMQTPGLSKLAKEGKRFMRSYASSSVCGPSRHSLMTGIQVGLNFVRGNGQGNENSDVDIPNDRTTIAEMLHSNGYETAAVGKWGMASEDDSAGSPCRRGFDLFFGFFTHASTGYSFPKQLPSCTRENPAPNFTTYPNNEGASQNKCFGTGVCTYADHEFRRVALEFIDTAASPFFLYWAPTAPHSSLYENDADKFDDCRLKTHPVPEFGLYANSPVPRRQAKSEVKGHKAMVGLTIDEDIKQLLEHLDENGHGLNTLVIFISDNGPHQEGFKDRRYNPAQYFSAQAGMKGIKRGMYEGSLRSPTIMWYPGVIPAGTISTYPIMHYDLALTIAKFAGINSNLADFQITNAGGTAVDEVAMANSDTDLITAGKVPDRTWLYAEMCHLTAGRNRRGKVCPRKWSPTVGCVWSMYDLTSWPKAVYKLYRQFPTSRILFNEVIGDPLEKKALERANRFRSKKATLMTLRQEIRTPFCEAKYSDNGC